MDELFQIESKIGEVCGILTLVAEGQVENDSYEITEWLQKVEAVEEAPKPKQLDEDGNEIEEEAEAPAEEADDKKPKWNPGEFVWSVTNGRERNLAQIYRDLKGNSTTMELLKHEEGAQGDFVQMKLDEFCKRVMENHASCHLYQQLVLK